MDNLQLYSLLQQEEYIKAKRDPYVFLKSAWRNCLEPTTPFKARWYQQLMAEYLQAVYLGQIKRIIFNIPPRHTKSTFITVVYPCWWWVQNPATKFLFLSYRQDLATSHSVARRDLIRSEWYQRGYGNSFAIRPDMSAKQSFSNNKRGAMMSSPVGTVIGFGGDVLIWDDPHDPNDPESENNRLATVQGVDDAVATRLNNRATSPVIGVMQRLHEKDCTGHAIADIGGYTLIKLPTENDIVQHFVFPISGRTYTRPVGELLHPEIVGPDDLPEIKRQLGGRAYAARHLQEPVPKEGATFKGEDFNVYQSYKDLPRPEKIIISLDSKFKETTSGAFACVQLWIQSAPNFYLVDQRRERSGFTRTKELIFELIKKWTPIIGHPSHLLIEEAANGAAIIETLRGSDGIPGIIPIKPHGSKEARAEAISGYVESGDIWIPSSTIAGWQPAWLKEVTTFPVSEFADQVDSFTQSVFWMSRILMAQRAAQTSLAAAKDSPTRFVGR